MDGEPWVKGEGRKIREEKGEEEREKEGVQEKGKDGMVMGVLGERMNRGRRQKSRASKVSLVLIWVITVTSGTAALRAPLKPSPDQSYSTGEGISIVAQRDAPEGEVDLYSSLLSPTDIRRPYNLRLASNIVLSSTDSSKTPPPPLDILSTIFPSREYSFSSSSSQNTPEGRSSRPPLTASRGQDLTVTMLPKDCHNQPKQRQRLASSAGFPKGLPQPPVGAADLCLQKEVDKDLPNGSGMEASSRRFFEVGFPASVELVLGESEGGTSSSRPHDSRQTKATINLQRLRRDNEAPLHQPEVIRGTTNTPSKVRLSSDLPSAPHQHTPSTSEAGIENDNSLQSISIDTADIDRSLLGTDELLCNNNDPTRSFKCYNSSTIFDTTSNRANGTFSYIDDLENQNNTRSSSACCQTSNFSSISTSSSEHPKEEESLVASEWARILAFSLIFVVGVVGNVLVVVTLLHHRNLRTVTNVFLLNLAVSDLLLGVFCMPFTLVGSLLQDFVFGALMCRLIPYMQAVSVSVSVWTLVAISLERYYAICEPLRSRRWQTPAHSYRVIAVVWAASLAIMSPIAALSTLMPVRSHPGRHKCREVWPSLGIERTFTLILTATLLLVPLVVMVAAYIRVVRTLWLGVKVERSASIAMTSPLTASSSSNPSEVASHPPSVSVTPPPLSTRLSCRIRCLPSGSFRYGGSSLHQNHSCRRRLTPALPHSMSRSTLDGLQIEDVASGGSSIKRKRWWRSSGKAQETNSWQHSLRSSHSERSLMAKRRVIRMLFVLVAEFFICWSPLFIVNLLSLYIPRQVYSALGSFGVSLVQLLAYISSCCNPITYCFMNAKFLQSFKQTFGCTRHRSSQSFRSANASTVWGGTGGYHNQVPLRGGLISHQHHSFKAHHHLQPPQRTLSVRNKEANISVADAHQNGATATKASNNGPLTSSL